MFSGNPDRMELARLAKSFRLKGALKEGDRGKEEQEERGLQCSLRFAAASLPIHRQAIQDKKDREKQAQIRLLSRMEELKRDKRKREEEEEPANLLKDGQNLSSSLPPPQFRFPWVAAADTGSGGGGTDGYAIKILSVDEIASKLGITEIRGEVVCSKCHQTSTIGFDLKTYSREIAICVRFYTDRLGVWDERVRPTLSRCPNRCGPNLKPVIPAAENNNASDYQRINWLFLFLGQMLGCCTVEQLDFFCKHSTSDYQTTTCGDKSSLLCRTYITLCKQLYPTGSFE